MLRSSSRGGASGSRSSSHLSDELQVEVDVESRSKRSPHDNAFKQQRLAVWSPRMTPQWVVGTYLVVAALFIPIGGALLAASQGVQHLEYRYDEHCKSYEGTDTPCPVEFTIDSDMDAPVYFYYKLTNYFQNHRRYVKSRQEGQLRGEKLKTAGDLEDCRPLVKYRDAFDGPDKSLKNRLLYPCGLAANSFFTDKLENATVDGEALDGRNWKKKGIAWSSDLDTKFKRRDLQPYETRESPVGFELPDVNDEDFVVWMRAASGPTFTKLYRMILDKDLKEGQTFAVSILNHFSTKRFDGGKYIVLSTASWAGGKNTFLGVIFVVVGCLSLIAGMAFVYVLQKAKSGSSRQDEEYYDS